jgi:benzoylformate decarboxylase
MAKNQITGRSAFLAVLKDEGVTHLFGNPGTTELPIMHALAEHPDLNYVMAMQESLVVAMADGFSRASGQLTAANVHVAPGLGNALGSLYNAKFTGTPIILTAGQQEQGHGLTEPLLYHDLVPMAAPLVKWAVEVTRLEDLPRIMRRAAKVAMTPPTGPVFISLPGDILNLEGGIDLGSSTRIDTRVRPSDEVLDAMAARILKSQKPIMIVGDEIVKSDALAEAAAFAEAFGCPVLQQSVSYGAHFLSENPCYIGGLNREQPDVRKALTPYDLMIAVGSDPIRMSVWSEVEPMPPGLAMVQIGLNDWDLAKNYPAEMAVRADVRETLRALTPLLLKKGGKALKDRAEKSLAALKETNWTAKRKKLVASIGAQEQAKGKPINPDFLTLRVVETLPKDAVVVNESLTSGRLLNSLLPYRDRYGYHGLASGGIGWSVPASVGIAMAQKDRPVLCFVGDGSAMYSIQAIWTAAHHKLPITYVVCNNGGYRIIKQRLKAFHGNEQFVGMDFVEPAVDFVGLAKSMGLEAHRVSDPAALEPALLKATSTPGTKLLEVMVEGHV